MISISPAPDYGVYHMPNGQGIGKNNFLAKERGCSYVEKGPGCRSPYPEKENGKAIQTRTVYWHSLIPFRGTYNSFQDNEVQEIRRVSVKSIFEDTAVVTLNNRHAAVLMGGCDAPSGDPKMNEHFMSFSGLLSTVDPYNQLLKIKKELSLFAVIMVGTSFMLGTLMPSALARLSGIFLTEKMFESVGANGLFKSLTKLIDAKGTNKPNLVASNYIPIPLIGLDTAAMRKRALEIREESEYNYVTRNCSWAVLECIKAGLPTEVVEKLPSAGLYTTPTDVENTIAFLIENEYVISGEVDKDGIAWFDARTDLD